MPEKPFREAQYMDDELYEAILDATGGIEPDHFFESSFGAAVTGPPDPNARADQDFLVRALDKALSEGVPGIVDSEGRLISDGPEERPNEDLTPG